MNPVTEHLKDLNPFMWAGYAYEEFREKDNPDRDYEMSLLFMMIGIIAWVLAPVWYVMYCLTVIKILISDTISGYLMRRIFEEDKE